MEQSIVKCLSYHEHKTTTGGLFDANAQTDPRNQSARNKCTDKQTPNTQPPDANAQADPRNCTSHRLHESFAGTQCELRFRFASFNRLLPPARSPSRGPWACCGSKKETRCISGIKPAKKQRRKGGGRTAERKRPATKKKDRVRVQQSVSERMERAQQLQ